MSAVIFVPRGMSVAATTTGIVGAGVGVGVVVGSVELVAEIEDEGGAAGSVLCGPAQPTSVRTRTLRKPANRVANGISILIADLVSPAREFPFSHGSLSGTQDGGRSGYERLLMTSTSLTGLVGGVRNASTPFLTVATVRSSWVSRFCMTSQA
jgi:hypothetical protein